MWGAVGYGIAVLISGIVYDNTGGGYGSVVIVFVVALALALVAALRVPIGATDKPAGGDMEQETRCVKTLVSCRRLARYRPNCDDVLVEMRITHP